MADLKMLVLASIVLAFKDCPITERRRICAAVAFAAGVNELAEEIIYNNPPLKG